MKQLSKANNLILSLYLFVMLGFFPLYYRYQYANMGDAKYKIFLYTSSVCVVVSFLLCVGRGIIFARTAAGLKTDERIDIRKYISSHPLDFAVLLYFCTAVISFLLSDFKEDAWKGSDGWYMGLLSQLLFVAVYFLIAKTWSYHAGALLLLGSSSAIVFIIAIFHRFDVDLIPIYGDLADSYKVQFLSTMGQASWYSSFLCTVFPIGLYIFFMEKDTKKRTLAGIYSATAMMSLVTQNTDSAYLSLFATLLVLFYLSYEEKEKPFLEVLILIFASFCFMGIWQRVFAQRMIPLDTMSLFMSQSPWTWVALAVVIGIYLWKYRISTKKKQGTATGNGTIWGARRVFCIAVALLTVAVLATVLFIILNSNGWLSKTFHYRNTNNYLLFNNYWGNGRGFAWIFAVNMYGQMPLLQKIFGVGPDCFSAYVSSVPEYLGRMQDFWNDLVLTNAHNEYLTKLHTLGIAGVSAYVGMLVTGFVTFMKNRDKNPLLPAFALCIVSYMVHNIFCYEQVCCTPFFYILMGIGSNFIHNETKKSTY